MHPTWCHPGIMRKNEAVIRVVGLLQAVSAAKRLDS